MTRETPAQAAAPITPADYLRANSDAYEWLVAQIRRVAARREPEAVLDCVASAARFAAEFHPGRFADGAIENLALDIGRRLEAICDVAQERLDAPVVRADGRRRVLHVAPNVSLGGHTPLMRHWVETDRSSCHSLVLLDQKAPVPGAWLDTIRSSGGCLVALPPSSPLQTARRLREVSRRSADLVAWHVIGADVIPTVAWAAPDLPPVALVDHCDHQFWLGSSVADVLVNLRSIGSEHTAERRYAQRQFVLPIPLVDDRLDIPREAARQELPIGSDQIVLLSVGRERKYRPCGRYDFAATAWRVLECEPRAHLYVLGASASGIAPYLRGRVHPRLHFMGRVDGRPLLLYRAAADVYLESFPYGSQTALLEAGLSGLAAVPSYAPLSPMLVAHDDAVADLVVNPKDEEAYVTRVATLVRNPEQRAELGRALRDRLIVDHVGRGWMSHLASLYGATDGLVHCPRPIPDSTCQPTPADVGLGLWSAVGDGRTSAGEAALGSREGTLRHEAFVARSVGDYPTARRAAWRAARRDPRQLASWRLLAVSLLGRWSGRLRRVIPTLQT